MSVLRNGNQHTVLTPPIVRLMARVVITPGPLETDCWLSTYRQSPDGYTEMQVKGKHVRAHRLAYEHFIGPIPEGMVTDHLCRVRHCVNPLHIEPVTCLENFLRGMSPVAIVHRGDTCRRGHSLEDAYRYGRRRKCRTCILTYGRERYRRLRAAA